MNTIVPPSGTICPPEVLQLCGAASPSQLRCPECNQFPTRARRYSDEEDWSVLLYCGCSIEWVVCNQCPNHRTKMREPRQYSFHKYTKHGNGQQHSPSKKTASPPSKKTASPSRKKQKKCDDEDTKSSDDGGDTTKSNDGENPPPQDDIDLPEAPPDTPPVLEAATMPEQRNTGDAHPGGEQNAEIPIWNTTKAIWYSTDYPTDAINGMMLSCDGQDDAEDGKLPSTKEYSSAAFGKRFFGNQQSSQFFWEEHNQSRGGVRSIVAKSNFGLPNVSAELDVRDVQYSTEIAHFCHGLTRGQRDHFASIMKMTVDKSARDNHPGNMRPWKVPIPCSSLHVRRHVTEYPSSYLSLIPTTSVTTLPSSFAYVRLRDCVQNFLAYGFELDQVPCFSSTEQNSKSFQSR
jgi:hypothetical protein